MSSESSSSPSSSDTDGVSYSERRHSVDLDLTDVRLVREAEFGRLNELVVSTRTMDSLFFPHQGTPLSVFSLDIGGTLIKLCFLVQHKNEGCRMVFRHFDSTNIGACIEYINTVVDTLSFTRPIMVRATGGGAQRLYSSLVEKLGDNVIVKDEMESLVKGVYFLLRSVEREAYLWRESKLSFVSIQDANKYPFILVNIGSGVSILRVNQDGSYERISGSSIGGGTFWGLCRLLTGVTSFDDALAMSIKGNHMNVDMLVGDIYGHDYSKIGLSSDTIASSVAKIIKLGNSTTLSSFNPEDITKSILLMVTNNIGQIAFLNAMRHNIRNIFFSGYFIRGHSLTMQALTYAINYWSNGSMRAFFLRHEGYVGAIGGLLSLPVFERPAEKVHVTSD